MSRAERLLDLLQTLRRHRLPVSGHRLAADLGVSLRTLYRDIATLQAQGAEIEGEPGIGYVLKPGFMLPPMMFSQDEIEALVLGSRWVARATDSRLAAAGADALAKIAAVLPADMREAVECLPACIGWRRSSQEKSSVVNISQLLALRAWTRRNRWQPAKWHRANVLADINGIRRLTAVSVFPVSHRSASVL